MTTNKKNSQSRKPALDPTVENPLIVDLPDGQKLVVGKLADGSIIEIATWRGTGRPDSRTSRLMLGMANGQRTQEAKGEAYENKSAPAKKPQELMQQAKSTFSGLKARFVPPAQTEAEQLVEEEFVSQQAIEEVFEKSSSQNPKNISHIQKAGAEYLDRLTARKSIRRMNRIRRDPVAAEIDLWFQKVLHDIQVKGERAERKKQTSKPKKKVTKKAVSRTSLKKKTPNASKTKKR